MLSVTIGYCCLAWPGHLKMFNLDDVLKKYNKIAKYVNISSDIVICVYIVRDIPPWPFSGFKVYKCHLSCHDKPHYHCHSCHKFIVRRCDYTSHIKRHPSPAAKHPGSPEKPSASAVVPPSPSVGPPGPAVVPPNPSMGPPYPHPRPAPSGLAVARGKFKVEYRPKFDVQYSTVWSNSLNLTIYVLQTFFSKYSSDTVI